MGYNVLGRRLVFEKQKKRINAIDVIDVGEYLITRAIEAGDGRKPTMMQILKLAYIAQGFHLSLYGKPLFKEPIHAMKYGPVVKKLYDHLITRKEGGSRYTINDPDKDRDLSHLEKTQRDILNVVFVRYGNLSGWDLSELTHKQGSPWATTYYGKTPDYENPCGEDKIIKTDLIEKYYKTIINPESFVILLSKQ